MWPIVVENYFKKIAWLTLICATLLGQLSLVVHLVNGLTLLAGNNKKRRWACA